MHNDVSKTTDETFSKFFEIFWKNKLAPDVEIFVFHVFVHENVAIQQTHQKHFDDNKDIV